MPLNFTTQLIKMKASSGRQGCAGSIKFLDDSPKIILTLSHILIYFLQNLKYQVKFE